jgi:rhodanese-related sulfurtransferase
MNMATGIGFFQLDNLIRNRVPFILLSEELPYDEIFLGPALLQAQSLILKFAASDDEDQLLQKLEQHPLSKSVPIVVVGREPHAVNKRAESLSEKGFLNIYYAEGGFDALKKQAEL